MQFSVKLKLLSKNRSGRREEAPHSSDFTQFEPRYLGCYEVLEKPSALRHSQAGTEE
jgi:hypothetical protein